MARKAKTGTDRAMGKTFGKNKRQEATKASPQATLKPVTLDELRIFAGK
jgi:hypothetical protein